MQAAGGPLLLCSASPHMCLPCTCTCAHRWRIWGRSKRYEAVVEATCQSAGTPLRAPTATTGLAPFCRDSFGGQVRPGTGRLTLGHGLGMVYSESCYSWAGTALVARP